MEYTTKYGKVGFAVKVHGKKVEEYPFRDQRYIWAKKKTEYSLVCWNNTPKKFEVVMSVDGLDILNGKEASVQYPGYVIAPNSSIEIPGYRLNSEAVAKFTFGSRPASYAGQSGDPSNIGVIGAAFYAEKARWRKPSSLMRRNVRQGIIDSGLVGASDNNATWDFNASLGSVTNDSFGSESSCYYSSSNARGSSGVLRSIAEVEPSNVGTVFGKEEKFITNEVSFIRDNPEPWILLLSYKSKEQLAKMGIDIRRKPLIIARPNPFPANDGCVPPKNWNR